MYAKQLLRFRIIEKHGFKLEVFKCNSEIREKAVPQLGHQAEVNPNRPMLLRCCHFGISDRCALYSISLPIFVDLDIL